VKEPRAGVISGEPNGDVVASVSDAHNITAGRVHIVVVGLPSAANDIESMSVPIQTIKSQSLKCDERNLQVERMGSTRNTSRER
jgi:hypothetical protein